MFFFHPPGAWLLPPRSLVGSKSLPKHQASIPSFREEEEGKAQELNAFPS